MRFGQKLLYLACATVLAGCGGGDSGDSGGGAVAVQQYPAGVWVGTAGPVGGTQRQFFGVIDGGATGQGGVYYFAKDTGGIGYDGLYGTLSVSLATLRATGSTYFSTSDAKFAPSPITVTGTVTGASADVKPNARISGNYSDPVGTAAATGTTIVPFTLSYSTLLTEHVSSKALIAGTYRTGGIFGSSSVVTIDALGNVTGTNAGCTLSGSIGVPNAATTKQTGIYSIALSLGGSTTACSQTGTGQSGVAVVQYDANDVKTGIWIFTYNTSGTKNTFVLNATVDVSGPTVPPSTTTQVAEGLYAGTVTTAGGTAETINGVVLPDNQYFFYRGNSGTAYDVLYGSLSVTPSSSTFISTNGIYVTGSAGTVTGGISLAGDVRTRTSLTASFADPVNGNSLSTIATTYNSLYTLRPANLIFLAGRSYTMNGGFLGKTITLSVDATGAVTGTSSDNCDVTGSIRPYSSTGAQNLYTAALSYSGALCPLLTQPQQTGVAVIEFNGINTPTGLRVLTVSNNTSTGERHNTVFLGTLVP